MSSNQNNTEICLYCQDPNCSNLACFSSLLDNSYQQPLSQYVFSPFDDLYQLAPYNQYDFARSDSVQTQLASNYQSSTTENYQSPIIFKSNSYIANNDWTVIHPNFDKKQQNSEKTYQQHWQDKEITYWNAQEWIKIGLFPSDYDFAYYLQKDGYQANNLKQNDLPELRKKCSWQDVHKDFNFERREIWEKENLKKQDVQELIDVGFKPQDYEKILAWKQTDFIPSEIKEWVSVGLKDYHDLASYLEANGYTPQNVFQEKSQAQHWLDYYYPKTETCIRENENIDPNTGQVKLN